jgi:peptidyl-prolyl cis-trans isomerase C
MKKNERFTGKNEKGTIRFRFISEKIKEMANNRIAVVLLAIIFCLALLTGCTYSEKVKTLEVSSLEAQPTKVEAEPAQIIREGEEVQEDKVVVTIDGTKITQSQIDRRTAPQLVVLAEMGQTPIDDQFKSYLGQEALNEILKEQLIKKAIESRKIDVTDEQISKRFAENIGRRNMTTEEFLELADKQGTTKTQIKEQIRIDICLDKLIELEVGSDKLVVTAEDARKYYDENINQFSLPERVRASHILFGTGRQDATGKPKQPDEKARAELKKKAFEVAEKLRQDGDFEELVVEYSVCQTKNNGGDLGYFSKDSNMDKDFVEAAFKLNKGDISDVVQTQLGYHIIKVTDRLQARVASFDEERTAIIKWLANKRKKTLVDNYIESLSSEAEIVWAQNK